MQFSKVLRILAICLLAPFPAEAKAGIPTAELTAAKQSFKFKGEWIHPKIIAEFLPWESDPAVPLVVAIDVNAATGTNRFFGEIEEQNGRASFTEADGTSTSYEWKGRLQNGMHVLVIRTHGSGTLVPTHLGVFKVSQKPALAGDGKKYSRLLLEVVRLVTLGDRAIPEVVLAGNRVKVDVTCEKTSASQRFELKF